MVWVHFGKPSRTTIIAKETASLFITCAMIVVSLVSIVEINYYWIDVCLFDIGAPPLRSKVILLLD